MTAMISPADLRARIVSGEELALIDLREEGEFANRHLLFAISISFSRLELRLGTLVPRQTVPVILCDKAGGDLMRQGMVKLREWGYTDVKGLDGGVDGWERNGFELFSGVNVPSKAFGEVVEQTCDTPHISAAEVNRMMAEGENMVVLDSRPLSEYRAMNIPTGIDVPGAELAYRVADLAPDPETTIVVNCAGRTRSIIGAQSLINAGVPNKVIALENGTMGWHLAGFELEHGNSRTYGALSGDALSFAQRRAAEVANRYGVKTASLESVRDWQADETRTTFLLDVRSPEEFRVGHLPGSVSAPGGQLVQATDRYVGVRGARLALIDNDGVRATMTASWLLQMGWRDVVVVDNALKGELEEGKSRTRKFGLSSDVSYVSPADLSEELKTGDVTVIDLANSLHYRDKGHIPGAWFAIRARLNDSLAKTGDTDRIVLTSPHGLLARVAAGDDMWAGKDVCVLEGGTRAWAAAGFPLETGFANMADETVDLWYRPYDMDDADTGAMKQYLSWEVNLIAQLERDGTTDFNVIPPKT